MAIFFIKSKPPICLILPLFSVNMLFYKGSSESQESYVFKVPGVRGGIVVLTWSHVRGGTAAKIFAPGGDCPGLAKISGQDTQKLCCFSALRAQNFFQGVNSVLTWNFSGGGVLS